MKKKKNDLVCHILAIFSIVLIIVSFILPPLGIIDNSVITATGIITLIITLLKIERLGNFKKNLKVSKGDFEIELKDNNNDSN